MNFLRGYYLLYDPPRGEGKLFFQNPSSPIETGFSLAEKRDYPLLETGRGRHGNPAYSLVFSP